MISFFGTHQNGLGAKRNTATFVHFSLKKQEKLGNKDDNAFFLCKNSFSYPYNLEKAIIANHILKQGIKLRNLPLFWMFNRLQEKLITLMKRYLATFYYSNRDIEFKLEGIGS